MGWWYLGAFRLIAGVVDSMLGMLVNSQTSRSGELVRHSQVRFLSLLYCTLWSSNSFPGLMEEWTSMEPILQTVALILLEQTRQGLV